MTFLRFLNYFGLPRLLFLKVEDLERFIDAPLHVVYLKQLSLLRYVRLFEFYFTLFEVFPEVLVIVSLFLLCPD